MLLRVEYAHVDFIQPSAIDMEAQVNVSYINQGHYYLIW